MMKLIRVFVIEKMIILFMIVKFNFYGIFIFRT